MNLGLESGLFKKYEDSLLNFAFLMFLMCPSLRVSREMRVTLCSGPRALIIYV